MNSTNGTVVWLTGPYVNRTEYVFDKDVEETEESYYSRWNGETEKNCYIDWNGNIENLIEEINKLKKALR